MDIFALFLVIALVLVFVSILKSAASQSNSRPLCKRHTWLRVDLTEEASYLKCTTCGLVAGQETSFEEKEPNDL